MLQQVRNQRTLCLGAGLHEIVGALLSSAGCFDGVKDSFAKLGVVDSSCIRGVQHTPPEPQQQVTNASVELF
eukprot:scaffold5500_cov248-Pinguiococcus_pyrenoidosus.AAC.7